MSKEEFVETIDKFRPDYLWEKKDNNWQLKYSVWKE